MKQEVNTIICTTMPNQKHIVFVQYVVKQKLVLITIIIAQVYYEFPKGYANLFILFLLTNLETMFS